MAVNASVGLREQVNRAIEDNPYCQGDQLNYEMHEGHVVLRGTVASFFHKQMAQEAVRRIDGVTGIENLLDVDY